MSKTFDKRAISELQKVRRANNGVLACARIINEHHQNDGRVPRGGSAWILLDSQHLGGLVFAIEACSEMIDDLFTNEIEDHGVLWHDEHLPEVRKEWEATSALDSGEIDYAEFRKRLDERQRISS